MNVLRFLLITALLPLASGCLEGTLEHDFPEEEPVELERAILTLPADAPGEPPRASQPIAYEVRDGLPVVEGDIVVSWDWLSQEGDEASRQQALADVNDSRLTWPDGIVPYVFARNLPKATRDHVRRAIAHYHNNTNLRFVPRTTQSSYLRFVPSSGCRAWVGRIGGPQEVWLAPECGVAASIHEMGHAVGLWHEHTRHDRDDYIRIRWRNIIDGHKSNFEKYSFGRDLGRYDINSIMHYHSTAFARSGRRTIVRRDGSSIGYNYRLSARDKAGLARIYPPLSSKLRGAPRLCLDLADAGGGHVAEMGRVRFGQSSASATHVVPFKQPFSEPPVVFAQTLSSGGSSPAFVQVVEVTTDAMTLRIAEWEYLDGSHTTESISYLAVLSGKHELHLPDGRRVFVAEADAAEVAGSFETLAVPGGSQRIAFAQAQTARDGMRKLTRIHHLNSDGFDVKLQLQQKFSGRTVAREKLGFINVTSGAAPLGLVRTPRKVGTSWYVVDFQKAGWETAPDYVALAQQQSQYGSDPAHLRYRRLSGSRLDVRLQEEKSADTETSHTTERVGAIALPANLFQTQCPAPR